MRAAPREPAFGDEAFVDLSDITPDEWGKVLVGIIMATYAAMMIPRLFRGNIVAALGVLLMWVAVILGGVAAYAYRFELRAVRDRMIAVMVPGTPIDTADHEVTVVRRPDGQFVVNGSVAGRMVPFVLDTGASTVVLKAEDAVRMKLPTKQLAYTIEVFTANGPTLAAEVELGKLSIGSITQKDVRALVARPGALNQNLLGMSFLNGLASFMVSNDRLVMRGR